MHVPTRVTSHRGGVGAGRVAREGGLRLSPWVWQDDPGRSWVVLAEVRVMVCGSGEETAAGGCGRAAGSVLCSMPRTARLRCAMARVPASCVRPWRAERPRAHLHGALEWCGLGRRRHVRAGRRAGDVCRSVVRMCLVCHVLVGGVARSTDAARRDASAARSLLRAVVAPGGAVSVTITSNAVEIRRYILTIMLTICHYDYRSVWGVGTKSQCYSHRPRTPTATNDRNAQSTCTIVGEQMPVRRALHFEERSGLSCPPR